MNYYENLKNSIDFFLREKFKLSRKNYYEINEQKDNLFKTENAILCEKKLFQRYDLSYLKSNSTKVNYLENLYTVDLLDRYLKITQSQKINVLDIGSKNWSYAKGEYSFFKKHCETLNLDGIEIDANRLYTNFYSRAEVAKFHINNLNNTNYITGDFLKHNENYDYIIWFLPFVIETPHVKWGLPKKYFQPEKMLEHAYKLLNKNGKIFIINQGESEYEAQKSLCEKLSIDYIELGKIESIFFEYRNPRYGIIIKN